MASFSVSGLVPMSAAIAGSEVAMTVESMFSMKRAVATMSGIRRSLFIRIREEGQEGGRCGLYHLAVAEAIAERPPNSAWPTARTQLSDSQGITETLPALDRGEERSYHGPAPAIR